MTPSRLGMKFVIGGAIVLTIVGAVLNPDGTSDCVGEACLNEGAPVAEWDR